MQLKCALAAQEKCDKDAEFMILGTAYCKEHTKERLEAIQKALEKAK